MSDGSNQPGGGAPTPWGAGQAGQPVPGGWPGQAPPPPPAPQPGAPWQQPPAAGGWQPQPPPQPQPGWPVQGPYASPSTAYWAPAGPTGPPPQNGKKGGTIAVVALFAAFAVIIAVVGVVLTRGHHTRSPYASVGTGTPGSLDTAAPHGGLTSPSTDATGGFDFGMYDGDPVPNSPADDAMAGVLGLLGKGQWETMDSRQLGTGALRGTCYPDGWGTGATSRVQVNLRRLPVGSDEGGTVWLQFTVYGSDAAAAADLARARTPTWLACEKRRMEATTYTTDPAMVEHADPKAPGRIFDVVSGIGVNVDGITFVGRMQVQAISCNCGGANEPWKTQVLELAAAVLASMQHLPAPGTH